MKQPELKYLDKRTTQRNIKLGFLKEDEHDKFLKSLPDDAENLVSVSFEEIDALSDEPLLEMENENSMDDEPEPSA